jgi:hypothetical protein
MEQGFIPDATDNTTKVTNWVEGQPQKRWYGLKTRGLRKVPIESWRCGRCGYLENYAPA